MSAHAKIDWMNELKIKFPKTWQQIYQVVIIPEYKEPLSVLTDTLNNLTKQDFPLQNLIIVIATESIDPHAQETTDILMQKYAKFFKREDYRESCQVAKKMLRYHR